MDPWNADVWVINPDGSGLQQITFGLSVQEQGYYETEDCYLRWSPDGSRITFTGLTANIPYSSRYDVYTMKSDGSNVLQLTACQIYGNSYPSASDCGTPSWSPDGNKIAWFDGDTPFGDVYGGGGIYTMNVDGTGITPVFQTESFTNVFPQWSSDGSRIIFTGDPSSAGGWGAYSINRDGSGYTQIIGQTKGALSINCRAQLTAVIARTSISSTPKQVCANSIETDWEHPYRGAPSGSQLLNGAIPVTSSWNIVTLVMALFFAASSFGADKSGGEELAKWRGMATKIQKLLAKGPSPCDPGSMRAEPIEAVELAGSSFALVDVCPLGAYTELIDVMHLQGSEPTFVRLRKNGKDVAIEFSRGASVMQGKDVKLVPEKQAIYDISWDNDGLDSAGTVKLQKCLVDAYTWNTKARVFEYNPKLTTEATSSYCHELEHQVH